MAGFFGAIGTSRCTTDVFYGTDYNSHLGTRRGGLATFSEEKGFKRSIHHLENTYFRTKFEKELDEFEMPSHFFSTPTLVDLQSAL